MTMNDLVWVQIFSPDVSLWDRFNAAYVKRFAGDLPARAFLGSGTLLRGGRFEMMGIAVRNSRSAPGGGNKRKGGRERRSKK
jgi:2-iminobutanoate/2-iminopropanoate deaminase